MINNEKIKNHKIWRRLFANIFIVLSIITLINIFGNTYILPKYFEWREKNILVKCAKAVESTPLDNKMAAAEIFQNLENEHNVIIGIYHNENLIYSTIKRNMFGSRPGVTGFDMLVGNFHYAKYVTEASEYKNGKYFTLSLPNSTTDYLVYSRNFNGRYTVNVIVQENLIKQSSSIAGEFIIIVSSLGLLTALLWSVVFSKRFSRPISDMNKIAVKMAGLDFSQKLLIESDDEIGQLACSINDLSVALDNALGQLNEQNRQLQNEIELERRIDKMRKGFIANVSHELKTPISIIQGYAEALDSKMAENPEKRKKYSAVIRNETEKMNHLVIKLLELSKLEGGFMPDYKIYDLVSYCETFLNSFSQAAEKRNVSILLDAPSTAMINADEIMIGNAIQNYVSNAISHVNEGGKINVRIAESPNDNQKIRLSVFNTGSSVKPSHMEKIWTSFWRADKSHNRTENRFGLGLSIVRAIILAHNNSFGVYNIEDGVCFWFELDKAYLTPIPQLPEKIQDSEN
ncbi:MAG: HAMP domain-containing protein [Clostridia bacterium]|nr:HAMP domain-containing protein [Clostridia bacterium]